MDKDSTPFLLPTDALLVVFQHLFAPDSDACSSGLPLSVFNERWTAVRATCSHWQEVLLAHPPPVFLDVSVMPEAWLPWILSLPVNVLRIEAGLDSRWSPAAGNTGAAQQQEEQPRLPVGMLAPIAALQLVAGLEGAGRPAPFWSPMSLTQLQSLHLQAPVSSPTEPAVFDGAAVRDLGQLTQLSLGSFADFQLDHLPTSLRRLHLRYDTQTRRLSMPLLPPQTTRLDLLRLEKPGALGLLLDDVLGRVAELDIEAQELLLGVSVHDQRLVATFERPYREGNFVPPHIWGDEEADDKSKQAAEMAGNYFLSELPNCARLQRLRLAGGAAASAKFMPVRHGARDSLAWLWSVVRMQGLQNLYGLSGCEIKARQQLFDTRLSIECPTPPPAEPLWEPDWCCISVVRDDGLSADAANGGVVDAL